MGFDTQNLFSLLYDLEIQYSSTRSNVCQTAHCAETSTQAEHSRVNVAGICFTGSLHFLALEGLSEPLQPLLTFGGYATERHIQFTPEAMPAESCCQRKTVGCNESVYSSATLAVLTSGPGLSSLMLWWPLSGLQPEAVKFTPDRFWSLGILCPGLFWKESGWIHPLYLKNLSCASREKLIVKTLKTVYQDLLLCKSQLKWTCLMFIY